MTIPASPIDYSEVIEHIICACCHEDQDLTEISGPLRCGCCSSKENTIPKRHDNGDVYFVCLNCSADGCTPPSKYHLCKDCLDHNCNLYDCRCV